MAKHEARSIAFQIFKRRLTAEIQSYWYCNTSFEYAERWWNEGNKHQGLDLITQYPGDNTSLFGSIDIPPSEYIALKGDVLWSIRCNAITNIVTAFETYLYYQTKRAVYINPLLLEKSTIEFEAKEIALSFDDPDQKHWFADKVVSKYIRNNSHGKMIKKIDSLITGGLVNGEATLISRWNKKVTLRNALIHNAKLVNTELALVWPEQFSQIGEPIQLSSGDIVKTHSIAYQLAQKIDAQFNRVVISNHDAKLLARVVYLHKRDFTLGEIADVVFKILNFPCTKDIVESAIAYQNRTRARIPDFTMMEALVVDHLQSCHGSQVSL